MSLVIDRSSNQVGFNNPTLPVNINDRRTPIARYRAIDDALASGFADAELHHHWGHDTSGVKF